MNLHNLALVALILSSCMKKELDNVMITSPGSANMYTESLSDVHVDGISVTNESIQFEGDYIYLYRAGGGNEGCTLSRTRLAQDNNGFTFIELDAQTEVCQAYKKCRVCKFKGPKWGDGCQCVSDPYVKTEVILMENKNLIKEWSYETR